jgi:DNA-binding beta-propeller fold protein YncE
VANFLKLFHRNLERKGRDIMKNIPFYKTIKPAVSRLRITAAGMLLLGAAALAAVNPNPPKLPWRVPTVNVGINPVISVVDQATHTIYVANQGDDTVSVIDGRRCNSSNSSRCSPIATLTVGPNPVFMAFDLTTRTLYATLTGGTGNTIAVVNANTCNARNTSGCGQTPAIVTVPGATWNDDFGQASNIVLDTANHTLYIGDAAEGPVSFLDTATCNGMNTSGCSQTPTTTATNGDSLTIDHTNHSVYVTNLADETLSVFDSATCNAANTSGCRQTAGPFPNYFTGVPGAMDETTHTIYMDLGITGALDYVAMIDGSTCNANRHFRLRQHTAHGPGGKLPFGDCHRSYD